MDPTRTPERRERIPSVPAPILSFGTRWQWSRSLLRAIPVAVVFACEASTPEAAAPPPVATEAAPVDVAVPATSPAHPGRIIAVGDLHGDLDSAVRVLQLAGVLDASGHWAAGDAVFVQTGDTTDRGPDSRGVIELLVRLEPEAAAAGGRVVALLGNHEAMNIQGDWRYVHPADVAGFGSAAARREAFSASGALGSWLRSHDVVAKVGNTIFAHGGISPAWAARGVDTINTEAKAALDLGRGSPVLGEEGPLWLREYLQAPESIACPALQEALQQLGAVRMVVGHTVQRTGAVAHRCDGALLGIDTGISAHYGGHLAAVQIDGGDARAVYLHGSVDLPDPPGAQ